MFNSHRSWSKIDTKIGTKNIIGIFRAKNTFFDD